VAALLQQGPFLLLVTSTSGVIEYVNQGFVRATRYAAADVLGRNVARFLQKGALCPGYPAMLQAVRARRPWCGLLHYRRRTGGVVPLVTLLSVTGDPHRDDTRVVAFAQVLADPVPAGPAASEADPQPRQQRLSLHSALLGHMAAALSHELNQPIGALANYHGGILRRLRAGTLSDGHLEEALQGASVEAERAKNIIRTIAQFVRTPPQPLAVHQLNSILRAVAATMAREVSQHQAVLSLELAPQLPASLLNLMEIEQVLLNVIGNSLDSLRDVEPAKRQLTLRSQLISPNLVRITVSDTGTGFTRDALLRAFDPFFTTKPRGMGMGLAICYNIIQAHGGRIWAESEPGNGARVHFELPAAGIRRVAS
jgi:signal transduction histidine kinase